jgi:SAM-dependent methyltransferase
MSKANESRGDEGVAAFEAAYQRGAPPPWDLPHPTPFVVELEATGGFRGDVLDAGCGTGENALYLASRGHRVVGVDAAPTAVDRARAKARERGLDARFECVDARDLSRFAGGFDTVLDSGLFHVFAPEDRARYAAALRDVIRPGGVLHVYCLSDRNALRPGPSALGTSAVTEAALRGAFGEGFALASLRGVSAEIAAGSAAPGPRERHFWLARFDRA